MKAGWLPGPPEAHQELRRLAGHKHSQKQFGRAGSSCDQRYNREETRRESQWLPQGLGIRALPKEEMPKLICAGQEKT